MNRSFRIFVFCLLVFLPGLLPAQTTPNSVIAPHAKDLVALDGEQIAPFRSAAFLRAPYTILYFGAGWCPDCRRFSPSLVAAYDHQPSSGKQFEVLLLSHDKNAEEMVKFMKTEKMNWPALAFEKLALAHDLNGFYSGHGIPCLTVIDRKGAVVLQSKDDQDANEVLQQLLTLVKADAK